MREVKVCVPSLGRPQCKTLDVVPWASVYVDGSEADAYRDMHPDADIVALPDGVQGCLERVRNYIMDNAGTWGVVLLDDDLNGIYRMTKKAKNESGYVNEKLGNEQIADLIAEGFTLCADLGYKFWGVNPTNMPNANMRNTPFSTKNYIGGPFQAFILEDMPLRYDEKMTLKEDYDMTLQQCRAYRGCLRLNTYFYTAEQGCKGNSSNGGVSVYRNMKREREQNEALRRKWGGRIVKIPKPKRASYDMNPVINVPIGGV